MTIDSTWFSNNQSSVDAGIGAVGDIISSLINRNRPQPPQNTPQNGAIADILNNQLRGFQNPFGYQNEANTLSMPLMLGVVGLLIYLFTKK